MAVQQGAEERSRAVEEQDDASRSTPAWICCIALTRESAASVFMRYVACMDEVCIQVPGPKSWCPACRCRGLHAEPQVAASWIFVHAMKGLAWHECIYVYVYIGIGMSTDAMKGLAWHECIYMYVYIGIGMSTDVMKGLA